MSHIVLLGDSIFDNKAYVGVNGKDVVTHLREILPGNWRTTLKAVDESLIENVSRQIIDSHQDATHFVISVGGNNAIMNADILEMKANFSAEVLEIIAQRRDTFEFHYREMLKVILSKNLPTALSTIYFPNFPNEQVQRIAVAALAVFNDVIIRQAVLNGLPLLDLRLICNEKEDYANEIEPSDKGGKKIAAKISDLVQNHDFSQRRTEVFF